MIDFILRTEWIRSSYRASQTLQIKNKVRADFTDLIGSKYGMILLRKILKTYKVLQISDVEDLLWEN